MNKRSFFTLSVQRTLLGISTHWRATYASKTAVVLLMVAVPDIMSVWAGESSYSVGEISPRLTQAKAYAGETRGLDGNEKNRGKIRKENEEKSKARDPLYSQQAASLAKQYKETAAMVARQGGDPQPLLGAAAYFERQSK
jgi:hypothetical protein